VNSSGHGKPVFRISGELYHYSGALTPPEEQRAQYAQVYLYNPDGVHVHVAVRAQESCFDAISWSAQVHVHQC
jgi:hypothetical protein